VLCGDRGREPGRTACEPWLRALGGYLRQDWQVAFCKHERLCWGVVSAMHQVGPSAMCLTASGLAPGRAMCLTASGLLWQAWNDALSAVSSVHMAALIVVVQLFNN